MCRVQVPTTAVQARRWRRSSCPRTPPASPSCAAWACGARSHRTIARSSRGRPGADRESGGSATVTEDRLGAGRIFHCMTSASRGLRPDGRACHHQEVHGGLQKDKQFIQGFIADSYMDITVVLLMTSTPPRRSTATTRPPSSISPSRCSCPPPTTASRRPRQAAGCRRATCRLARDATAPHAHRRRPRRGAQGAHRQERHRRLREGRPAGTSGTEAPAGPPATASTSSGIASPTG